MNTLMLYIKTFPLTQKFIYFLQIIKVQHFLGPLKVARPQAQCLLCLMGKLALGTAAQCPSESAEMKCTRAHSRA